MRLFGIPDAWQRLRSSKIGSEFPNRIRLEDIPNFPEELELPSPLTLIFGLNGAGKSRMLASISSSYKGSVVVSLSNLIYYLKNDFGKRSDIADLMEEADPLTGDKVRRSEVSGLVRRDYQDIQWYVVSIADSPFRDIVGEDVVPIFTVRHGGQDYDFRDMGLGELSAHLLLWILAYTGENSSFPLLLDEPEAFMPAPSRVAVLEYLLEETKKRKHPVIVASHSLEMIQPAIDANSAVYLSEKDNVVSMIGPSPELADRVAGLFGKAAPADRLFLCEDESAYILGDEIIRVTVPRIWQGARFLWCKGYGDLKQIWEHLPRPSRIPDGVMKFVFLADGDKFAEVEEAIQKRKGNQKGKENEKSGRAWPFICLPGDPDALMKQAGEEHAEWLSSEFRYPLPQFQGLLERLRGSEAHNWVEAIIEETRIDRQSGLRYLARAYLRTATSDGSLSEFEQALRKAGSD